MDLRTPLPVSDLFDADIDLVYTLVKSRKAPNENVFEALKSYYIFRMYNYLDELDRFYLQGNAPEGRMETFTKIKSNLEEYKRHIRKHIKKVNNMEEPEMKNIIYIFTIFANLLCIYDIDIDQDIDEFLIDNIPDMDEDLFPFIYPLVNNTGIFSYNSYVYAVLNLVCLIGFPSQVSKYDAEEGCPIEFMHHDINHTLLMLEGGILSEDNRNLASKMYYKVLSDDRYSTFDKESFVFTLWIAFHESNIPTKWLFQEEVIFKLINLEIVEFGLPYPGDMIYDIETSKLKTILTRYDEGKYRKDYMSKDDYEKGLEKIEYIDAVQKWHRGNRQNSLREEIDWETLHGLSEDVAYRFILNTLPYLFRGHEVIRSLRKR